MARPGASWPAGAGTPTCTPAGGRPWPDTRTVGPARPRPGRTPGTMGARHAGQHRGGLLGDLGRGPCRVGGRRVQGQLAALAPVTDRPDHPAARAAPHQERGVSAVGAGRVGAGKAVIIMSTRALTIAVFA